MLKLVPCRLTYDQGTQLSDPFLRQSILKSSPWLRLVRARSGFVITRVRVIHFLPGLRGGCVPYVLLRDKTHELRSQLG